MSFVYSGRVVMLVRAMEGGGAQRDAVELANGLAAQGWPMAIATLDASGSLADMRDKAIPLLDLGNGKRRRMAMAVRPLVEMFEKVRPSAVIASEAAGNCLLSFAALRVPALQRPAIVLREVAVPSLALRNDPYLQNRVGYRLARWLYARADRVVSLTAGVRDELITNFAIAPERAVNLGTNAVLSKARLAALAVPVERVAGLAVAVGRLSPEKGFAELIAAFAQVEGQLDIVGEGPERARLEQLIARLGLRNRVRLPGFHPDPTEQLRRATLFVSASHHEGFGNAIVEALACGTPVVATDAPYGPRSILDGGHYGVLVPPGDQTGLALAIRNGLNDTPDRAALRRRADEFTTERAAAGFGQVLADLGMAQAVQP